MLDRRSQGAAVDVVASRVCWLSREEDENRRVLPPGVDVDVVAVGANDAEDADPSSPCKLILQVYIVLLSLK